jgi:hypothetical protein
MSSEHVPVIYLTNELAQKTAMLLDSFALRCPSEGVVYWFGIESGNAAVITTLVVPDADTSDGCVHTSAVTNAAAIRVITGSPLVYIGQAHSHPGHHVSHSPVDDAETFARFEGAISVVVPWFGRYGLRINECGVYRHLGGRFRGVSDVDAHLRIMPGFADLRTAKGEGDSNAR